MIPFIRIHGILETESALEIDDTLNFITFSEWKQIGEDYRLRYIIRAQHLTPIPPSSSFSQC